MNKFYNIHEAVGYLSPCLLCRGSMGFACLSGEPGSQLEIAFDNSGYGDFSPILTYSIVDSAFEDKFTINTQNNGVRRHINRQHQYETAGSHDGILPYTGVKFPAHYPITAGIRYLYLGGTCPNCKKYGYVLQIVIQLKPLVLMGVVFNSETVTFQVDNTSERWELKNVYTTKQTVYSHFATPVPGVLISEAKQNFPLLPIDREDPTKTLSRVKNLLIFT